MADNEHSIKTYVSDMLALERHIHVPFETQLKDEDFTDYQDARQLIMRMTKLSETHVAALDGLLDQMGGHQASPVKSAVLQFEGIVAGAIDKMRKTKVSKALRDDYTALALCTASYTMLHATANAMAESAVATLAKQHLEDYTQVVMDIGEALPVVVVKELASMGMQVDTGTIARSVTATQQAWRPDGSRSTELLG
ncbi:MAG: hypothetical protein M3Z14_07260 [Candidatus Eremiobacteraeota bacterium]|nr:hypothetical protein [Candidatus Eremiobacteraeota bacterium]